MSARDARFRIHENALLNTDLTPAQRVFLLTVLALPAEYRDGRRRVGSMGITDRGRFALHHDYLARALGTSVGNVKKMCKRLEAMGYLNRVQSGTYGRPTTWHVLDVRGVKRCPIELRRFVPPYDPVDPTSRGVNVSPLALKTPTEGDHAPTDGVPPTARAEVEAPRSEAPEPHSPSSSRGCDAHPWFDCPPDCRNAPTEQRGTA